MSNIFSQTPFFEGFPDAVLDRLEQVSVVRKYKKSTHLMGSGDECHAAYVVLDGSAVAYADDSDGEEFIINTFKRGEIFGELGILDDLPRTANVVTTSACECLVIPKAELKRAIESEAGVAAAVIKTLVGRIRCMTEDVSSLALMDVYGRLARIITTDSKMDEYGVVRMERVTHQELSNRVGASREMVSKIIKDLKTGGYIRMDGGCMVIERKLPSRW